MTHYKYLASIRCKSMPENAFDILQTIHLVKTQKITPPKLTIY